MTKIIQEVKSEDSGMRSKLMKPISRTNFLKFAGATAAVTSLVLAGCDNDDDGVSSAGTVDLGSGDTGILNYAYLLEQLEAAFYVQVIATPFSGMTAAETALLTDIRDHELAHRDFFKTALGASAIASVEVNFTSIDFTNRASVLGTAKAFEDLGVSAYNGAGKLIENVDYLLLAGKIVSVEARHASAIRDLLNPFSADYAGDDVVTVSQGLDGAKSPAEVLTIASAYVKTTVKFDKLPS